MHEEKEADAEGFCCPSGIFVSSQELILPLSFIHLLYSRLLETILFRLLDLLTQSVKEELEEVKFGCLK